MSKAIGGYVRRSERRYVPPAPRMLGNMVGPAFPPERAPAFSVPPGEIMASLLGAPERPGPPYVHTLAPPEPIGTDGDGNDIYPEPGPAYTLTEGP